METSDQITKWGALVALIAGAGGIVIGIGRAIFRAGKWKQRIDPDAPTSARQSEQDHGASMGLIAQVLGVVNGISNALTELRSDVVEDNRKRDEFESEHRAATERIEAQQHEIFGRVDRIEVRLDRIEFKS